MRCADPSKVPIQVTQAPSDMKYRSRVAIASNILQVARAGNATKTRLMYGSFLSFAQINEYLGFLRTNRLIVLSEETRVYSLTEKGLLFLRICDELSALVPFDGPIPAV
jgi:predicted transcriptional regulator